MLKGAKERGDIGENVISRRRGVGTQREWVFLKGRWAHCFGFQSRGRDWDMKVDLSYSRSSLQVDRVITFKICLLGTSLQITYLLPKLFLITTL